MWYTQQILHAKDFGITMYLQRKARKSDLEQVYSIYMHDQVVPYLGYDPMPLSDFRSVFDDLNFNNSFYVVEIDGVLAGFYSVARFPGRARHVAQLRSFAVAPHFQGQGIGKRMIRKAIAMLKSQGIKRIEIIVESDNWRAIALYRQIGFDIEGKLKMFYKRSGEDHYVDDYIMAMLV